MTFFLTFIFFACKLKKPLSKILKNNEMFTSFILKKPFVNSEKIEVFQNFLSY